MSCRKILPAILWATVLLAGLTASAAPSLVVVISIDQFRADYLERFRPYFGTDGFNRLLEQGAVYTDCHHRHSITKTGPGHASILTGVHANIHGIIANDWLDHDTLARVSCVGDESVQIVGLPPSAAPHLPGIDDPYLGRSPVNLLAETVGDGLKQATAGRAKVFGVAGKDRASILMSGHRADAAYFLERGRMVTSTYYMAKLPAWAERWNEAGKANTYFGKVWDRLLPAADYDALQGPDDAPGEDDQTGNLGRVFPKTITGGESGPRGNFYGALENTPFENEVVENFAETLVTEEKLGGQTGVTDLLCLGFSANDHAGHLWGPDSHEVMDITLRTDRLLGQFFKFLDARIGLAKCLIILTADHGVSPTPEHIHAKHPEIPAGRINGSRALAAGEAALDRAYGPLADKTRWLVRDDAALLIFPAALKEKKVEPAAAQAVVRDALLPLDFVQAAYTRVQLEKGAVTDDLGRAMLLSFNRARSGDVLFQPKPYYFSRDTGANHGTPYDYDTHVPLVWYGAGVKAGVHRERVGVNDLAPTLAHFLGLAPPPRSEGHVLFAPAGK